jgi:hypothetical protein
LSDKKIGSGKKILPVVGLPDLLAGRFPQKKPDNESGNIELPYAFL